jgi:hypothetical protein
MPKRRIGFRTLGYREQGVKYEERNRKKEQ